MASQKGLGKGLGALLGDFSEEPLEKSAYQQLPIYKVEPNPDQPRQDFDEEELQALADSMRMLNENAPNDQVIKLKALEALEKVADGKATKIIIPSEIQGLAGLAASTKALVEGDKAE